PYYTAPVGGGSSYVDYSQPVQYVNYQDPSQTQAPGDSSAGPPASNDGMQAGDQARQSFYNGDYSQALKLSEQAISQMPGDPNLHEFRALCLFALGHYQEAAAAIHSVLAVGPGWDWTTMSQLYPNVDVYTKQLRALEAYRREHPEAADACFLLAYHYLTD